MANQAFYHFNETLRIPYHVIADWTSRIFQAAGLNKEDAELVADSLVMADARGVYSHGVLRISLYTERIFKNCVDTGVRPELIVDNDATGIVDGHNAMGQVVGNYAMRVALEKAEKYGVSFITARGSNHYGTCAYYAMMALRKDMIGFSASIGGGNLMAPWGGSDARIGNNPFCVAIPALNRDPVVLDMAESVVANGKIVMATKTNSSIPDSWAFDKYGVPTTDPYEALKGTLRPIADYKGSGIAIVIGLLSSVISDAAIGATLKHVYKDFSGGLNKGQMFLAVDLKRMTDAEAFKKRMDQQIDFIKASPLAKGADGIYLPGEIEYVYYRRQMQDGIEYPVEVIDNIRTISNNLGVAVPQI